MEKAAILAPGRTLIPELLPSAVTAATAQVRAAPENDSTPEDAIADAVRCMMNSEPGFPPGTVYRRIMATAERPVLVAALDISRGNQLEASRILGINRNTLRKKIREYGLNPKDLSD